MGSASAARWRECAEGMFVNDQLLQSSMSRDELCDMHAISHQSALRLARTKVRSTHLVSATRLRFRALRSRSLVFLDLRQTRSHLFGIFAIGRQLQISLHLANGIVVILMSGQNIGKK